MREYAVFKNGLLAPGKRRNVMIVLGLAFLISIPLIAMAATGFFRKNSSASTAGANGTVATGDDGEVSWLF